MMKKFIVFLCVAGVLTGCAVGGEKTTAPKQEAKTEEVQEKETEKTEQKTEEPKETAETAEESGRGRDTGEFPGTVAVWKRMESIIFP